jgi:CRISPR-associated protein Csd2
MGRKHTIAYGLYRAQGFVNAAFAAQTGFTEADLSVLWRALANMFDMDRSAARGLMCARGLYIFRHSSTLGEAPAHKLFERVKVTPKPGVESPRSFDDYTVAVDEADLPPGVTLSSL